MDIPVSKVAQDSEDRAGADFRSKHRSAKRKTRIWATSSRDKAVVSPSDAVINLKFEGTDFFVLKTLTPREEKVIKMRFGLDDGSEHTLEEVGQSFAVTRERISPDRSEGAAQAAAPVAFAQTARVSRGALARLPLEKTPTPLNEDASGHIGGVFICRGILK